jgi:hypothetical protein
MLGTQVILTLIATGLLVSDALTVYGVTFNEPVNLPECETWSVGRLSYVPTPPKNGPCLERQSALVGSESPLENEHVMVRFPVAQAPEMPKFGNLSLDIVEGRVQRVFFLTKGLARQETDLRLLTEKFGKPHSQESEVMQNSLGASFTVVTATWNIGGSATALYAGSAGSRDQGIFVISTAAGEQAHNDRQANPERTKL